MSKNESTEYNGPDTNEVYSDEDTFESFDDLDEDVGDEVQEEDEQQSARSDGQDDEEEYEDEEDDEDEEEVKPSKVSKKEASKKARGQKGDDMETLDRETEESFEDLEEEGEEKEEEEVKEEEVKPVGTEDKKSKIKPTYVEIDGETFSLASSAIVSVPVDGKTEKITLQELKNNYSGKVFHDKRINEVNLYEQSVKKKEQEYEQKFSQYRGVKQQIDEIIKDPSKNPKDALKIFLDSAGVDSYDLMERMFEADLSELANVLNMEPNERKAHFLEKKNSHLLEQSKKRDEIRQSEERVKSYKAKTDALRNSSGVSEAQYMDALDELKSFGHKDVDISEQDIVEWAATKPHRAEVKTLLEPYKDQFQGDAYGELSWKLAKILQSGSESKDIIKKHLAEIYGLPTEVKELSKKLNPLGRKSKVPAKVLSPKKGKFESFDDIDD